MFSRSTKDAEAFLELQLPPFKPTFLGFLPTKNRTTSVTGSHQVTKRPSSQIISISLGGRAECSTGVHGYVDSSLQGYVPALHTRNCQSVEHPVASEHRVISAGLSRHCSPKHVSLDQIFGRSTCFGV